MPTLPKARMTSLIESSLPQDVRAGGRNHNARCETNTVLRSMKVARFHMETSTKLSLRHLRPDAVSLHPSAQTIMGRTHIDWRLNRSHRRRRRPTTPFSSVRPVPSFNHFILHKLDSGATRSASHYHNTAQSCLRLRVL
jgi:hypothetical protein